MAKTYICNTSQSRYVEFYIFLKYDINNVSVTYEGVEAAQSAETVPTDLLPLQINFISSYHNFLF